MFHLHFQNLTKNVFNKYKNFFKKNLTNTLSHTIMFTSCSRLWTQMLRHMGFCNLKYFRFFYIYIEQEEHPQENR